MRLLKVIIIPRSYQPTICSLFGSIGLLPDWFLSQRVGYKLKQQKPETDSEEASK